MTSAGFNTVRALRQGAIYERRRYPIGSQITLNDFYCDDLLSGASNEVELVKVYYKVTKTDNFYQSVCSKCRNVEMGHKQFITGKTN